MAATGSQGPGIIVRAVWFVLVGWWLGQLALLAAWFLNVLIVTLPLGLYILNRLPQVITLRGPSEAGGSRTKAIEQRSFRVRSVYFVLVGWWLSLVWMEVAWLVGATIVLLPVSFVMYSKSAAVATLRRT